MYTHSLYTSLSTVFSDTIRARSHEASHNVTWFYQHMCKWTKCDVMRERERERERARGRCYQLRCRCYQLILYTCTCWHAQVDAFTEGGGGELPPAEECRYGQWWTKRTSWSSSTHEHRPCDTHEQQLVAPPTNTSHVTPTNSHWYSMTVCKSLIEFCSWHLPSCAICLI